MLFKGVKSIAGVQNLRQESSMILFVDFKVIGKVITFETGKLFNINTFLPESATCRQQKICRFNFITPCCLKYVTILRGAELQGLENNCFVQFCGMGGEMLTP